MLDEIAKQQLLTLARSAVDAQVLGRALPIAPNMLAIPTPGVFVSLHHGADLRGCLGTLGHGELVGEAVVRLAAAASHEDPRFSPVTPRELADLAIEISVLTPRQPLVDVADIEIGRHGLIVEKGWHRGLLLPQVATEHGWDARTFLAHACLKAELPPDAWRTDAVVSTFEADVFGDSPPRS